MQRQYLRGTVKPTSAEGAAAGAPLRLLLQPETLVLSSPKRAWPAQPIPWGRSTMHAPPARMLTPADKQQPPTSTTRRICCHNWGAVRRSMNALPPHCLDDISLNKGTGGGKGTSLACISTTLQAAPKLWHVPLSSSYKYLSMVSLKGPGPQQQWSAALSAAAAPAPVRNAYGSSQQQPRSGKAKGIGRRGNSSAHAFMQARAAAYQSRRRRCATVPHSGLCTGAAQPATFTGRRTVQTLLEWKCKRKR